MAITVVGSVALDTVETPFAGAEGALGGAASYFTIAASLYDTVNLVAVIGDDFPARYMDYFKSRPVDLRGLQVANGKTFRWGGRYQLDMNTRETLFTELGVFGDFRPTLPEDYRRAAITFLANIQPQLQLGVLRQAREGGSRLVALDTMNLWIETAHDDLFEVLRGVDVVLIAEDEAREIAGTPNLRTAARTILDLGPKTLIVKLGSYGSLLYSADGAFFAAPAYPLEDVCDPTGAGDAFAGGFLGYLAECAQRAGRLTLTDYRRALIHGNIMGSFACEQFSVERLRTLTPEDIANRYQEFVRFTHFEIA
ncbi:MAG TPA: PfkB family carbohydrate kinase [Ktedonobacterales bacterium]|nr:PfkB family carbohydrate kinase [Ktedonobacterales bacterium]